ncbi:MAG TPA: hypothetical protein VH229_11415 [Candidatus Udaeobacter sp.]|nr:hypothetical protein [Candidatus Udaeobacter sp.]
MIQRPLLFVIAGFAWPTLCAGPPERSVSPSHQFVIYGADAALRGAVSNLAERTKTNFLTLLRQRDDWAVPIVINLEPQQANLPEVPPASLRFSQTGFGLKLQVDLTLSRNLNAPFAERALLRSILLEMMYRKQSQIVAGSPFVEPPDWLIDGVLALTPGRDRGALVDALTTAEKTLPLEKFLRQRPALLDSTGRVLYQAYAFTLVQMLLDGTEGSVHLAQYMGRLSRGSSEPLADLKAQFPFLAGDAEGTWQLSLRRLKNFPAYQLLTFAETDRRLAELLRLNVEQQDGQPKVAALRDLAQRRKLSPNEKTALSNAGRELLVFVAQANPVLRPVAREYQQIAALLVRGKRKGVAKRLAKLEATHSQLASRMSDIDDYMNWFEATQMPNGSGNFEDYLKAVDHSQTSASKRRDPLTVYVDALEDQLEE